MWLYCSSITAHMTFQCYGCKNNIIYFYRNVILLYNIISIDVVAGSFCEPKTNLLGSRRFCLKGGFHGTPQTPLRSATGKGLIFTPKRKKLHCQLPNDWTSSTLLSSPSQDHSMGSVAACNTHVGQSCADSRSRPHSSDSSEGILQDYVVVSSDDLPTLEGENDRLYMVDEQARKQICQFKKLITTRFSLPRSPKLFKLHKGPKTNKYHMAPTPYQRSASHEVRPRENSPAGNRTEACASEVARFPPVGKEKEEPELTSSFYSEETGRQ